VNRKAWLKTVSIFSDLDDNEVTRIAERCHEKTFAADEIIFVEHTEGDEMYVIIEGEVSIQLELANEDDMMPLITLKGGDIFGELSVVDECPRSATARSASDTKLLVLSKKDFDNLMESDHELGYKVMKKIATLVSRRVRHANQKILDNVSWGML
jgi:CRP-like cAMP-binding protein